MMKPDDLIVVDMKGNKIEGRKERTSEILMHITIYEMRPDIFSVVHAHPPVATGFAAAGRPLNLALLPEVIIGLGCVPLADYGLPGTPALTEPMLPYIPKYEAIMMGNHGAVCYGEDVYKAFFRMETVEHFARISLVAELLGGANCPAQAGSGQAAGFAHALRREVAGGGAAGLSGGGRGSGRRPGEICGDARRTGRAGGRSDARAWRGIRNRGR